jgi:hypothetical protein
MGALIQKIGENNVQVIPIKIINSNLLVDKTGIDVQVYDYENAESYGATKIKEKTDYWTEQMDYWKNVDIIKEQQKVQDQLDQLIQIQTEMDKKSDGKGGWI